MRWVNLREVIVVLLVFAASLSWHEIVLARAVSSPFGDWPKNWPKELEPFRERAESVTDGIVPGVVTQYYIIEFQTRAEFESVWPALLRLKSKGAPITLRTPDKPKSDPNDSRVVFDKPQAWIKCPPHEMRLFDPSYDTRYDVLPDGTYRHVGPWTDDLELPGGVLPQHVVKRKKDGKWIAWDGRHSYDDYQSPAMIPQARVELQLYVDGKVLDLNRIQLPKDTPIIDMRTFGSIRATR